MKYCPNPQCPYALRHHEGQEFRDHVAACTDCGAELVAERPIWPRPSVPNARGRAVWLRLAVTLLAPPLVLWLHAVLRVPRFNLTYFESRLGRWADAPRLTVFGLALWPVFIAFIVVEASALAWPSWRPLRHGGPAGRARLLRAAFKLGLGFAALQALTIAMAAENLGFLEPDPRLSRLVVALSLVAGVCVLVWLAQLLDRFALGGGFSVLALAFSLPSLDRLAAGWRWLADAEPLKAATTLAGILVAGVATFIVLRRRLPVAQGKPSSIRLPACGVIPLRYSVGLRAIHKILTIASLGQVDARWLRALLGPAWNEEASLAFRLFVTGVLAVGFGFLFNRPGRLAALDVEGLGISPQAPLQVAREEVVRAIAWSAAYVLGLALLGGLLERTSGVRGLDFVPAVMLVAVGLDVAAEVQARRRHGELIPVWPEHRLYAVDGALALLQRAGIPCLARSVHHRALWHFFAPFIPIQILVPPSRAEEASRLLHEHFGEPL